MRRRPLPAMRAAAFAALSFLAAAALGQLGAESLNSERIEAAFGSYGIEVLRSDGAIRISDLYSTDAAAGERTTRTLALVRYPPAAAPAFAEEHAAIVAGGSIGATFKAAGWTVVKTHDYIGERAASARLEDMMRLTGPVDLAVHVYALDVVRENRRLRYATILEMHHPDYLTSTQVREIYAPDWHPADNAEIGPLLETLVGHGF